MLFNYWCVFVFIRGFSSFREDLLLRYPGGDSAGKYHDKPGPLAPNEIFEEEAHVFEEQAHAIHLNAGWRLAP